MGFLKGWTPQLLSIFRIMTALLFLEPDIATLAVVDTADELMSRAILFGWRSVMP